MQMTIKLRRVGSGDRVRRQWSEAQRRQIVQESLRVGTVAACRRHGLHPSLLTKWRARQRDGRMGASGRAAGAAVQLLPVEVQRGAGLSSRPAFAAVAADTASRTGAIEVEFASGRRLCIRGVVDGGMLRSVFEELVRS